MIKRMQQLSFSEVLVYGQPFISTRPFFAIVLPIYSLNCIKTFPKSWFTDVNFQLPENHHEYRGTWYIHGISMVFPDVSIPFPYLFIGKTVKPRCSIRSHQVTSTAKASRRSRGIAFAWAQDSPWDFHGESRGGFLGEKYGEMELEWLRKMLILESFKRVSMDINGGWKRDMIGLIGTILWDNDGK